MNTATNNIDKLKESSQKRGEARRDLSEYFSTHQHDLSQELINAWGGFERLELEARTIETEAISGIEEKIEKARFVKKFNLVTGVISVGAFLLMIGLAYYPDFFSISNSNNLRLPSRHCTDSAFR